MFLHFPGAAHRYGSGTVPSVATGEQRVPDRPGEPWQFPEQVESKIICLIHFENSYISIGILLHFQQLVVRAQCHTMIRRLHIFQIRLKIKKMLMCVCCLLFVHLNKLYINVFEKTLKFSSQSGI